MNMEEIIKAEYIKNYVIKIYYANGKSGNVDFEKYIDRGGVFRHCIRHKYVFCVFCL